MVPGAGRAAGARPHAPRSSTGTNLLSFFGLGIAVHGEVPDLNFYFGPHVVHRGRVDLSVEISAHGQPGRSPARQMCVRRSDGLPLLRRQLRGWTNVPPPIPPFAAMVDRVFVVPAAVMAKSRSTIALIGSALSPKAQIALSLAYRSWRFVGTQFLVVDRRTGEVLPHLVPLELRGAAIADAPRSGMVTGSWRSTRSALTGDVMLARPESLGTVERIDARLSRPNLIGLCRTTGPDIQFVARDFPVQSWPPRQKSPLSAFSKVALELPDGAVADEAADKLDDWFAGSL